MSQKIPLNAAIVESFKQLIVKHTGLVIREQEIDSFWEKISLRIKASKASSPENYYQLLEGKTLETYQEWEKLIILLTNNESYFFRDKEQLNLLKDRIFPELIKRKQAEKTIRICSAGCSTGQEVYTLAIILQEMLPDLQQWNLLILGIDIDSEALKEAAKGVYDPWSFRGVDEVIKQRYFQKINNQYHLKKEIKNLVKFRQINLVKDSFPQSQIELRDMDLIVCRNVFIYFDNPAIGKVLDKIYHTLQPSGYFLTGHTELSAQNLSQFDKLVFSESIVYQRPGEKTIKSDKEHQLTKENKSAHRKTNLCEIEPKLPIINYRLTSQAKQEKSIEKLLHASDLNINHHFQFHQPRSIPAQPSNETLFLEIENLLAKEKYNLALDLVKQIIQRDSNNFKAYYLQAQIYANLGQYDRAIQSCQQAIQIDSFALTPYYLLAKIAEERGNLEEAKRLLKQIIYLEPSSANAYLDLSHIYKQQGDLQRANKMEESARNLS